MAEDYCMPKCLADKRLAKLTAECIEQTACPILKMRGVSRALLFGSYARGEQTELSDVDIAIDEGAVRGLAFFSLQCELSDALGKHVDLQSLNSCNKTFVLTVEQEGIELYSA